MNNKTFFVVGGDLRQLHLAELLSEENTVYTMGFDNDIRISDKIIDAQALCQLAEPPQVIILPIPTSVDSKTVNTPLSYKHIKLSDVIEIADKDTLILAGKPVDELKKLCEQKDLPLIDYMDREELSVLNAVPTAEGALQIAMEELPITLYGSNCLITGMGRIAKVLVRFLCGMGANVTVAARKQSDLAWAKIYGCSTVYTSELGEKLGDIDVVFNTVPAMILNKQMLSRLDKNCLVIDLASKPGGVDFKIAKELSLKTIWALSLPGKVAPISAGKIIKDTIDNIMRERREEGF